MGYGSVQVPVAAGVGESIVLLPAGLLAGLLPVYLKGSVLALSVTFGDTLPLLSLRDIFPRPGEVFPQRESLWRNRSLCG